MFALEAAARVGRRAGAGRRPFPAAACTPCLASGHRSAQGCEVRQPGTAGASLRSARCMRCITPARRHGRRSPAAPSRDAVAPLPLQATMGCMRVAVRAAGGLCRYSSGTGPTRSPRACQRAGAVRARCGRDGLEGATSRDDDGAEGVAAAGPGPGPGPGPGGSIARVGPGGRRCICFGAHCEYRVATPPRRPTRRQGCRPGDVRGGGRMPPCYTREPRRRVRPRTRACSSADRASASGAEGRRFESCRARQTLAVGTPA